MGGIANIHTVIETHRSNADAARQKIYALDPQEEIINFFDSQMQLIFKTMIEALRQSFSHQALKQKIRDRPIPWKESAELKQPQLIILFLYHAYRPQVIQSLDKLHPKLEFMEYSTIAWMSEWNCHCLNKMRAQLASTQPNAT